MDITVLQRAASHSTKSFAQPKTVLLSTQNFIGPKSNLKIQRIIKYSPPKITNRAKPTCLCDRRETPQNSDT